MYLIAGDDRHLLREGITLIGSADNDRYSCIRLSDKVRPVVDNKTRQKESLSYHSITQLSF